MIQHHNEPPGDDSLAEALADKCGCIPLTRPHPCNEPDDADAEAPILADSTNSDAGSVANNPPAAALPRGLKLVVVLEPTNDQGYRALLALGAADCDPLFRSVPAEGLVAALAAVPALLADAQARWQSQPRYPTAAPVPAAGPRPTPSAGRSTSRTTTPAAAPQSGPAGPEQEPAPPSPGAGQSDAPTAPGPGGPPAPSGQLSLFS